METRFILLGTAFTLLFSACGKSSPRENFLNNIEGVPPERVAFFSGNFKSECVPMTAQGVTIYGRDQFQFFAFNFNNQSAQTNAFLEDSSYYPDSACSNLIATSQVTGSFAFSENNKVLTLSANGATLTPKADVFANALNQKNTCGVSAWITDKPEDLFSDSCSAQAKAAQVYYVNASVDEKRVHTLELFQCADQKFSDCKSVVYTNQF